LYQQADSAAVVAQRPLLPAPAGQLLLQLQQHPPLLPGAAECQVAAAWHVQGDDAGCAVSQLLLQAMQIARCYLTRLLLLLLLDWLRQLGCLLALLLLSPCSSLLPVQHQAVASLPLQLHCQLVELLFLLTNFRWLLLS
jgi:hypothetical protein